MLDQAPTPPGPPDGGRRFPPPVHRADPAPDPRPVAARPRPVAGTTAAPPRPGSTSPPPPLGGTPPPPPAAAANGSGGTGSNPADDGVSTGPAGGSKLGLDQQQVLVALFVLGAVVAVAQLVVLVGRFSPPAEPGPAPAVAQRSEAVAGAVAAVQSSMAATASLPIGDLARSVVLIQGVASDGTILCTGSGTVVSADGLILTNAHVVHDAGPCDYERLLVAVTDAAEQPPVPRYAANVVAYDPGLDLAVLHVSTTADGAPTGPLALVPLPIGNSDEVVLGQPIRILGYPGIGGHTITYTAGSVAGFAGQDGLGDRAWIKTDATVAGGNSGGLAIDGSGRLVAVPTRVTGGEQSDIADCRVVQDTDGDGALTEADACIPVGGFIDSLRPINLARPLLDQAQQRQVVAPEVLRAAP